MHTRPAYDEAHLCTWALRFRILEHVSECARGKVLRSAWWLTYMPSRAGRASAPLFHATAHRVRARSLARTAHCSGRTHGSGPVVRSRCMSLPRLRGGARTPCWVSTAGASAVDAAARLVAAQRKRDSAARATQSRVQPPPPRRLFWLVCVLHTPWLADGRGAPRSIPHCGSEST